MIETTKYVRKPLFVDAVRVTQDNFEELAKWCQGEIVAKNSEGEHKAYIKVRVHNPKFDRQSKAFIGEWILYSDRGYKIYTNKAFRSCFDLVGAYENNEPTTHTEQFSMDEIEAAREVNA